MTIETTNASRGRSMKTPEIMASCRTAGLQARVHEDEHERGWRPAVRQDISSRGSTPGRREDGLLHDLARPYLLDAVDDHLVAFLHARVHHYVGAAVGAGLNAPLLDLVLGIDDKDVVSGLIDLQRRLRDHQARRLLPLADDGGDELPVGQHPFGIGHGGAHDQRVGPLIDLRVGEVPGAAMGVLLAVGQAQPDLDLAEFAALLAPRLADRLEVANAHRKQHIDRILAHDGGQHAARRVDEVAYGEGGAADAAVDRRADVGVVEIDPGLGERRLGLHDLARRGVDGGLVLVDRALRAVLTLVELDLPVVLQLRIGELGLGHGEVGLGLVDQCLKLHLLDLVEQVARLDLLSFLEFLPAVERHLVEKTLDAGADLDFFDGLDAADKLEGLADALHGREPHADGGYGR